MDISTEALIAKARELAGATVPEIAAVLLELAFRLEVTTKLLESITNERTNPDPSQAEDPP